MTEHLRRALRALLSVSDKTGLVEFARALAGYGVELVSTGGTRKALSEAGLAVADVSDLTGFPEMMDGRVKTLHPAVHGGLLAVRDNPEHAEAMRAHGIRPIDLLVVNLYPFEETVARGADFADCIENIDIGGPAMIRAAAKNHDDVAVVVDAERLRRGARGARSHGGMTTLALRRRLAAKAFARTAAYDAAIANWFADELGERRARLPRLRRPADRGTALRREPAPVGGVLSHARRALRRRDRAAGAGQAALLQQHQRHRRGLRMRRRVRSGAHRRLRHHQARQSVRRRRGRRASLDAYRKALACDPVSAFGGIVALNRTLDAEAARAITEIFTEVIIAPDATDEAIAIVGAKKNLRLLLAGGLPDPRAKGLTAKTVAGGLLVQIARQRRRRRHGAEAGDQARADRRRIARSALCLPRRQARQVERHRLRQGFGDRRHRRRPDEPRRFRAHRRAQGAKTPPRRPASTEPATKGSVVASDAFFPFADGLLVAIEAGATAVIQPGGSMRDDEVIKAADDARHRHGVHRHAAFPALERNRFRLN